MSFNKTMLSISIILCLLINQSAAFVPVITTNLALKGLDGKLSSKTSLQAESNSDGRRSFMTSAAAAAL